MGDGLSGSFEIEVRGVLVNGEYEALEGKLKSEGTFVKRFDRLLLAYSCIEKGSSLDVRCRLTGEEPELIVKIGEQGSTKREEISVRLKEGEFLNAVRFMASVGYPRGMMALRSSERYIFGGVEFTLVRPFVPGAKPDERRIHSSYYEAEISAGEADSEGAKAKIFGAIKSLKLTVFDDHREDADRYSARGTIPSRGSYHYYVDRLNKEANTAVDFTQGGYEKVARAVNLIAGKADGLGNQR